MKEPLGKESQLSPIINPKYRFTTNCVVPACISCWIAFSKKRPPGVVGHDHVPDKEGVLSWYKYKTGDFVSADQFFMKTSGWIQSIFCREGLNILFHGGTILSDDANGIIWVKNQISLGSGETVMGKQQFEEWLWYQAATEMQNYHVYNGILTANTFRKDCKKSSQYQSYSGSE